MNDEKKKEFLEALSEIGIITIACAQVGLSRNTVYRWMRLYPSFLRDVKFAIAEGNYRIDDLARGKLIENIKRGHYPSIKYRLERAKRIEDIQLDGMTRSILTRENEQIAEEEKA